MLAKRFICSIRLSRIRPPLETGIGDCLQLSSISFCEDPFNFWSNTATVVHRHYYSVQCFSMKQAQHQPYNFNVATAYGTSLYLDGSRTHNSLLCLHHSNVQSVVNHLTEVRKIIVLFVRTSTCPKIPRLSSLF